MCAAAGVRYHRACESVLRGIRVEESGQGGHLAAVSGCRGSEHSRCVGPTSVDEGALGAAEIRGTGSNIYSWHW